MIQYSKNTADAGGKVEVHFSCFVSFPGAWDLLGAYWDMREANYQHSARYFHARGNYDAAQRGPGGVWAAKVISNVREYLQGLLNQDYFGSSSYEWEDLMSNRKAEEWGRSGNDPEHFRPAGLPEKY
ncbi:serum amyloid A-4 protein-like [Diceros bicornis minor]|uniref:serum amyloid A-4 protein-like n=1 Tax=Diceros bicornis minor TaxID=77932 RepID=UPI0026F3161B|nr:serum amyloid A-4 protein-like [Diceros bicornis minor]